MAQGSDGLHIRILTGGNGENGGRRICREEAQKAQKYRFGVNHGWTGMDTDTEGFCRRKPRERRTDGRRLAKTFGRKEAQRFAAVNHGWG